jgi:hypothetical protein
LADTCVAPGPGETLVGKRPLLSSPIKGRGVGWPLSRVVVVQAAVMVTASLLWTTARGREVQRAQAAWEEVEGARDPERLAWVSP